MYVSDLTSLTAHVYIFKPVLANSQQRALTKHLVEFQSKHHIFTHTHTQKVRKYCIHTGTYIKMVNRYTQAMHKYIQTDTYTQGLA